MRWVTGLRGVTGLVAVALLSAGCGDGSAPAPEVTTRAPASNSTESKTGSVMPSSAMPASSLTVTSEAFGAGEAIPTRYSCKGENSPPPLAWTGVPSGAAELALVVDDPDAVSGLYIHWVVTGIQPTASGSPEGGTPPGGTVHPNSGGDPRYLGPCPPAGTGVHHYRFTLYVLDAPLNLAPSTPARKAAAAIAAAASAQARLVGTYRG